MEDNDEGANADRRAGWRDKGLYDRYVKYLDEETRDMVTLNCVNDSVLHSNQCTATPDTIRATGEKFNKLYQTVKKFEIEYGVPKVADIHKRRFDEANKSLIKRLENE